MGTKGNVQVILPYLTETYGTMDAPLIFTLFVSKSKDIVHCLKLSAINPSLLKRLLEMIKK